MANGSFDSVMESLLKGMNSLLGTKTVVGDPTQIGDTVIVPLMDVSFGAGAGTTGQEKKEGSAGGFAAKMSPTAVLVIKDGMTKIVNIRNQDVMTKLLDMIPDLAERFSNRKAPIISDEAAVEKAFPEGTDSKIETEQEQG